MHATQYSASIDESAMIGCFLLLHEIAPDPRVKQYPVVDLQVSGSLAQSKSVRPVEVTFSP